MIIMCCVVTCLQFVTDKKFGGKVQNLILRNHKIDKFSDLGVGQSFFFGMAYDLVTWNYFAFIWNISATWRMLFFFFHFYVKTQCNKLVFSGAGATASLDLGAAYSRMAGLTLYFFTIKTKILQKIILLYTVSGSIMSSKCRKNSIWQDNTYTVCPKA